MTAPSAEALHDLDAEAELERCAITRMPPPGAGRAGPHRGRQFEGFPQVVPRSTRANPEMRTTRAARPRLAAAARSQRRTRRISSFQRSVPPEARVLTQACDRPGESRPSSSLGSADGEPGTSVHVLQCPMRRRTRVSPST